MDPLLDPIQAAAKEAQTQHFQHMNEQRKQYAQKGPHEKRIDMGSGPISLTVANALVVLLDADEIVDLAITVSDSEESIVLFAKALEASKHLTNFKMSGKKAISQHAWQRLVAAAQSSSSLKSLSISFANIGIKEIMELYSAAQESSCIKKLIVNGKSSRCSLGINDPEPTTNYLNSLVLNLNNSTDCDYAERLFQKNMSLHLCEITGNEVKPYFIVCLKGAMEKNTSLNTLVIDSDGFDNAALAYLSESLSAHVKSVDIAGNFDETAYYIAALMFSKGLQKVTLSSRQEFCTGDIEKHLKSECNILVSAKKITIEKKRRKSTGGVRRLSGKRKSSEVSPNKVNNRQSK